MIKNYSDGPSINIINYMHKYKYKSPKNWNGVRNLIKK